MYAIIETGGKQYWVSPGDTLKVEKLDSKEGQELVFKALWAASGSEDGGPQAKVTAEVLGDGRARKILVFKKRPKKTYSRQAGHRQAWTEIRIKDIQHGTH